MATDDRNEGLPDIIKKIMESPEIADIIKSAGLSSDTTSEETAADTVAEEDKAEKSSAHQLSPDILTKLPQVLSALSGMGIGLPQGQSQSQSAKTDDATSASPLSPEIMAKLPQVMSALSGMGIGGNQTKAAVNSISSGDKNRRALLSALKPYMNDRKKSVIDTMLGLNSLTEIMTSLTGRQD